MRFFLFFVMAMFSLQASAVALACLCTEMTEENSLEVIENAEFIFRGRIVMLETMSQPTENFNYEDTSSIEGNPLYSKARLKVIGLYKGAPETERFTAYIDTATSCGSYFEVGDVSNFVLNRQGDGVLVQADLCNMPLPEYWNRLIDEESRE